MNVSPTAMQVRDDFQGGIASAVFAPDVSPPVAIDQVSSSAGRFDVYRNNVVLGLINALAARYPVVSRMLWDDGFRAVARLYIEQSPPRSPVLLEYGQNFPDFIRHFGDCPAREYVADVAALEDARVRAYHAADAVPLDAADFAALDPGELAATRVQLHPSVTMMQSSFPVVSVWEAEQAGDGSYLREWKQEAALIARPNLDVEVRLLPDGGYRFLSTLADGCTIAEAIEAAQADCAGFDLAANLAVLIGSGIVVALLRDES